MPPTTPLEDRYGRSQKKNIALAAWHAPLGGRVEEADLCRGQGFGRAAPSAPPGLEDRHVQGPPDSQVEEGILTGHGIGAAVSGVCPNLANEWAKGSPR